MQISKTGRERLAAAAACAWIGATSLLGGCSWLHFGTPDDETYDYRKAKPRNEPLDVPPDLSQLPKDDRFSLPASSTSPAAASASSGTPAAPGAAPPAAAVAAPNATVAMAASATAPAPVGTVNTLPAAAGVMVAPAEPNAHIVRDGNVRWLAVNVSPEVAYTTLKDMWVTMGYKIERDEPLVGIVETGWSEDHPMIEEDMLRNGLHKALGAFDSNGNRNLFRARIERTANNTSEITITHRAMVEVLTGVYKDSSRWQAAPTDPELEAEMLQRLALRFTPAQPLRVAVAGNGQPAPAAVATATPATVPVISTPANSRVHKVASGGNMSLQVEDTLDRTWRMLGVALDRGGFTVEDRRRDRSQYAVRYLDPDYEASERAKRSWWDKIFNSDAKVPEQQFVIALSVNGAVTAIEVQDKDGHPDNSPTARHILDQLLEQLQ